jgi:serine/threonine protein kinase
MFFLLIIASASNGALSASPSPPASALLAAPPAGGFAGGLLAGRAAARVPFDTFVSCGLLSPHLALFGLRVYNATALESLMGSDAPKFHPLFAGLFPGCMLTRYLFPFFWIPVDSLVAVLLGVLFVANDALLWYAVYLGWWVGHAEARPTLRHFFVERPLLALLVAALRWALVRALQAVEWIGVRGAAANVAATLVLDVLAAGTLIYAILFFLDYFRAYQHAGADAFRWTAVRKVCEALHTAEDLYHNVPWTSLYELVAEDEFKFDKPSGGTQMRLGRNKLTHNLVVIKAHRLSVPQSSVEMMVIAALRCVQEPGAKFARGRFEEGLEALSHEVSQLVDLIRDKVVASHDRTSRLMADHEVKALRAVAQLELKGVVEFLSAHLAQGHVFGAGGAGDACTSAVIVTSYVGPSWRARPPETPKEIIGALRYAARTLAKLHSAGIAHRDIKLSNFASPEDDVTRAVLLDLGISAVQQPTGTIMAYSSSSWSPPEWSRTHGKLEVVLKGDVFSFALLAVKLFVGPRLHIAALLRKTGLEGGRGAWSEDNAAALLGELPGPHSVPPALKTLLAKMLDPEPARRPTMEGVRRALLDLPDAEFSEEAPKGAGCEDPRPLKKQQRFAWRSKFRRSRLSLLRQVIACVQAERGAGARALVPDPPALVRKLQASLSNVLGARQGAAATLPQFVAVLRAAGLLRRDGILPCGTTPLEVFRLLDADESGDVSRQELLAGLAFLIAPGLDTVSQLTLVFHAYDVNGDNSLSMEELASMLHAYHFPPPCSAAALFERFDADHNGKISLEEFVRGVRAEEGLLLALEDGGAGGDVPPPPKPPAERPTRASSVPRKRR